jgi:hypothetical protein
MRDWLDEVGAVDGNGCTGRLLLNLLLARLGYPPAMVQKRERIRYLNGLRAADAGRPGALAELLARAVLDNLYRFVVPAVAGPVRLVPLAARLGLAAVLALGAGELAGWAPGSSRWRRRSPTHGRAPATAPHSSRWTGRLNRVGGGHVRRYHR